VTASKNGGKLKLLNLTKRLNDLLVVTKLSTVFDVVDKESDF
jgi:anti-sigma B factor antagonist